MTKTAKEKIISDEVVDLINVSKLTLLELDTDYKLFKKIREQFPFSFVTREKMSNFLSKNNDTNNKNIETLKNHVTKLQKAIKIQENKKDDSLEREISEYKSRLSMTLRQIRMYQKLLKKVDEKSHITYFYEDLMLFCSELKHETLDLWKNSFTLYETLDNSYSYYKDLYFIEVSEDIAKSQGFRKPTADIRNAVVGSRVELKDLKDLASKARVLKDSARKLLDCFEYDEVNIRKFADRKDKVLDM